MKTKILSVCLVMAMIFAFVGCTDVNQAVIDEALEIQELRAQPQAIKFVFEVTNMEAGEEAYINGTFWDFEGGGWPNGWAQESWNDPAKKTPVAEVDGVANFGAEWDVTITASIGDTLTFKFKTQCNSDWSSDSVRAPGADQEAELVVEKAGTFKVSINSSTWEVSITEVE